MRSGKNTEVFRTIDRDDIPEDCAFSIIHGDDFIVLDLIAHSSDDANIWITGLRCLLDSDLGKLGIKEYWINPTVAQPPTHKLRVDVFQTDISKQSFSLSTGVSLPC